MLRPLFRAGLSICYGRAEDILVKPVIVAKFGLRHIERKIFLADLMKRSDHATLEDRPETFEGIGMHGTNDILPLCTINDLVRVLPMQLPLAHY